MNRSTTLRLAGASPAGLAAVRLEPWTADLGAFLSLVNGLLALGVPTVMRLPRRPSLLGDASHGRAFGWFRDGLARFAFALTRLTADR